MTQNKPFSIPEINLWMDESTYLRVSEMIGVAAGLFGDGAGKELGLNVEYERGQIELICAVNGIPLEHRDEVRNAIYATAEDIS